LTSYYEINCKLGLTWITEGGSGIPSAVACLLIVFAAGLAVVVKGVGAEAVLLCFDPEKREVRFGLEKIIG
jgi:hypothetical protein